MRVPLEDDIVERIRRDFALNEADEAIRRLGEHALGSRVRRCIVVIADGNLNELKRWIEFANLDSRDVISRGECDREGNRLRHLSSSFLIEGKVNFWIAHMADILDSRGFRLVDLKSQLSSSARNKGKASSDYEGHATFLGETGTLQVRLEDGNWTLIDETADLEVYGLGSPTDDSNWFHAAVSRFAAMKGRGLHVRRDSGTTENS